MQTLNQRYAKEVFNLINLVAQTPYIDKKDFVALVKKLPARITHNGLLTTLAFLYSKAKYKEEKKNDKKEKHPDVHVIVLIAIVRFLKKSPIDETLISISQNEFVSYTKKFIEELTTTDFRKLMLYSQQALTFSQWLKRLAEGTFKEADNVED